jgi:hypothetical protein
MTSAPAVVASSTRPPRTSITLRPSSPAEHLGEAIAELASRLHAATYELLVLLREFDAQAGWNNGFLSCAHWLSWRTGIDPGAAREKVRIARALASLPRLSGAMQRGEISYAKVRALTRVATPGNEERLLDIAYAGTAAHVERVVRAWRRCDRVAAAQETERRHLHRELHTWVDDDGMLVIRGRLTPELGAVVQRALDAASDALFREAAHAAQVRSLADEVTPAQRRADALGRLAECALAGDLDGGKAGDRYQVVLHVDAAPDVPATGSLLEVPVRIGVEVEHAALEVQDGGIGVSAETVERLTCDAAVVMMRHDADGSPLDVGRKTRTIPPAIRRALQARDKRCQFPGCAARRCDAHHLVHWAHGGATGLDNLTLLCRRHHRLAHEGGIGVRRGADGQVVFHRANGTRIEPAPAPPLWRDADTAPAPTFTSCAGDRIESAGGGGHIASPDPLAPVVTTLARQGIQINAHSAPCWDGTPFNLAFVIDALLGHRPLMANQHTPTRRSRVSRID